MSIIATELSLVLNPEMAGALLTPEEFDAAEIDPDDVSLAGWALILRDPLWQSATENREFDILAAQSATKPEVEKDEVNKLTKLTAKNKVLVSVVRLEHH